MAVLLDFEQPIADLEEQIETVRALEEKGDVDVSKTIRDLEKKLDKTRKEIYSNLTSWQRVQVSRHPERPYTLSYIEHVTNNDFLPFYL